MHAMNCLGSAYGREQAEGSGLAMSVAGHAALPQL